MKPAARLSILLPDNQLFIEETNMSDENDAARLFAKRQSGPNKEQVAEYGIGQASSDKFHPALPRTIATIASELEDALRASGRIKSLRAELEAALGVVKRPRAAKVVAP